MSGPRRVHLVTAAGVAWCGVFAPAPGDALDSLHVRVRMTGAVTCKRCLAAYRRGTPAKPRVAAPARAPSVAEERE